MHGGRGRGHSNKGYQSSPNYGKPVAAQQQQQQPQQLQNRPQQQQQLQNRPQQQQPKTNVHVPVQIPQQQGLNQALTRVQNGNAVNYAIPASGNVIYLGATATVAPKQQQYAPVAATNGIVQARAHVQNNTAVQSIPIAGNVPYVVSTQQQQPQKNHNNTHVVPPAAAAQGLNRARAQSQNPNVPNPGSGNGTVVVLSQKQQHAQPNATHGLNTARSHVQNPTALANIPAPGPAPLSASATAKIVSPVKKQAPSSSSSSEKKNQKSSSDAPKKKESSSVFQTIANFVRGSGDEKKAAEQELNEIKNSVQSDLSDSNGAFATLKQAIDRLRTLLRLKSNSAIPSLIPFRSDAQPNTVMVSVDREDEKVFERIVLNVAARVADPVTVDDVRALVRAVLSASTEFSSLNYAVQLNPIVIQTRSVGQQKKWAKATIELVITQMWEAFVYEAYLKQGGVPPFYSFLKPHLAQTDYFWLLRKDGVSSKTSLWADYQTELLQARNAAIEAAANASVEQVVAQPEAY